MLSWDMATCWQKLEEFCEEGKDKQSTEEVNLGHANRIIEALARYDKECEAKVQVLLSEKVDEVSHSPMKWLEPLVVRLAGEIRSEPAIPIIVAKLHVDDDLLSMECEEALVKIGTPSVLQAVANEFLKGDAHFRLYATGPLEYIHCDLAVEKCLHVLSQEQDRKMQMILGHALLFQFAKEGIEATRQLLLGRELDFEDKRLRDYLVETGTFMEERFPEYDEWLAAGKAENEENRRRSKELEGDPYGTLAYAFGKGGSKKSADVPQAKPTTPPASPLPLPRPSQGKEKVGRNDPCPCGSGKKFKNCCMKKQG